MSKIDPLNSSRLNRNTVILGYLCLLALGLLDNMRGPFFPDLSTELSLQDAEASLYFVATSILAFGSGLLVPQLVQKRGLFVLVWFGLSLLGFGFLASSYANNLLSLVLSSCIFGVGFGVINVVQNLLVIKGGSERRRRQLLNGLHGTYALAALTAPSIAALLFKLDLGWRISFRYAAGITLVGIIYSFFVFVQNKSQGLSGDSDKLIASDKAIATDKLIADSHKENQRGPSKTKSRPYLNIGFMLSFYVMAEVIISTRLPLYLRRSFEVSASDAATVLAYFFACLFLGRLVFLIFNFSISSVRVIEICLYSSLVFYVLGLVYSPYALVICGLTMAPIFGTSVDLIAKTFNNEAPKAVSICVTIGGIFLVIMHLLMGILSQEFGIHLAMYLGVFTLLLSIVALQKIKKFINDGST